MKRKRDEKIENRSIKTTITQELTVINESVKWVDETRFVHYFAHGPLFARFFSIDEITGGKTSLRLKIHASLIFKCRGEEKVARFALKVIEGAEKFLNLAIQLHYSYDDVKMVNTFPHVDESE